MPCPDLPEGATERDGRLSALRTPRRGAQAKASRSILHFCSLRFRGQFPFQRQNVTELKRQAGAGGEQTRGGQ